MKKTVKRSSDILVGLADDKKLTRKLTYRRILQELGERAFGVALLFFALPSALPFSSIPGISAIFSVPILIFAFQMLFARKTLWLPKFIADRPIRHKAISTVIHTFIPYLIKIEYLLKPRWSFMNCRLMEILNGSIIICLAIFLMLPIPFSNFLFAALLIIFSLGLIEKDGIFILLGYVGTILYISFIYLFILKALKYLFN